jgi:hypothetical protein
MINKLWRFGDSWSTTDEKYDEIEKNHSHYVSEHFGLELNHHGRGGHSNLHIFSDILRLTPQFKEGDMVLINFACKSRIGIINKSKVGGLISTADGGTFTHTNKDLENILVNDVQHPISDILFYLIRTHLHSLISQGIKVYHFYNDNIDENPNITNYISNELIFNSSKRNFQNWIREQKYEDLSPKGNVHYLIGKQRDIANKIIDLIESNDK